VELPSDIIFSQFGARYILSDLFHKGFLDQAAMDPRLVETYRDEYAVVFAVIEK
jgi:aromatic ring hydroxylase